MPIYHPEYYLSQPIPSSSLSNPCISEPITLKFVYGTCPQSKSGGYESTDKEVMRALENAKKHGINLIGIGIPDYMKKPFSFAIDYTTMKKSVKKNS